MRRRFVESTSFSEDRRRLERARELSQGDLIALEQSILADPQAGDLVPGTGGLRKVRLGQRAAVGGTRQARWRALGKREKSDLSLSERRAVALLVKQLKEETR